jgi:hypothetical protein
MSLVNNKHANAKISTRTAVNLSGVMIRIVLVFLHGCRCAPLSGAPWNICGRRSDCDSTQRPLGVRLSAPSLDLLRFIWRRHEPGDVFRTLTAVLKIGMPVAVGIGLMLTLSAGSISGIFHTPTLAIWLRILGVCTATDSFYFCYRIYASVSADAS